MDEHVADANEAPDIKILVALEMDYYNGNVLEYLQKNGLDSDFRNYLNNEAKKLSNILSSRIICTIEQHQKDLIYNATAKSCITSQKAKCINTMQNILLSIFSSQLQNFGNNSNN